MVHHDGEARPPPNRLFVLDARSVIRYLEGVLGRTCALISCALMLAACGRIGFGPQDDPCAVSEVDDQIAANAYYVANDGDDANNGRSPTTAWRTVAQAWARIGPGDTLVVRDGMYGPLDVRTSGQPGAPITVRAEHDGAAVFDGGGTVAACAITGTTELRTTDIVLTGIRCQNGVDDTVRVVRADRITVRRLTAAAGVSSITGIIAYSSADVLLEDVAVASRTVWS